MQQLPISRQLLDRFFHGDRLACARLITLVDNHAESVPAVLDCLYPHMRHATRVGITGPPGVGKSTITAALARQASRLGQKVGIIAVDPSSPFTGGAFLGDRVRMQNLIGDSNVFIRSLASRSGGGLSPSTPYVADVFDAFGMDIVLIETVGVGQAELDVLTCSDLIMLVLQPSTGDVIQMLKAGIMETADIFVINKADLPGADQLADYIQFIFQTSSQYVVDHYPPVIKASALKDSNVDMVFDVLQERISQMIVAGKVVKKREERLALEIEKSVKNFLWEQYRTINKTFGEVEKIAAKLVQDNKSPYTLIEKLCGGIDLRIKDGNGEDLEAGRDEDRMPGTPEMINE